MKQWLVVVVVVLAACSSAPEEATVTSALQNGNCRTDEDGVCRCIGSPLVLDLAGDGIHLTDAYDGVVFALNGTPRRWAWTIPGDDALLALDRNGNGTIDDGAELFGDSTLQQVDPEHPTSTELNGFLALAVHDNNGDGWIDSADAAYSALRLWQDVNHDGVSQPDELSSLEHNGVHRLGLAFTSPRIVDEYGNEFRFAAQVVADAPVGATAYDVFVTGVPVIATPPPLGGGTTQDSEPTCYPGTYCWDVQVVAKCASVKLYSAQRIINDACNNGWGRWFTIPELNERVYLLTDSRRAANSEVGECPTTQQRANRGGMTYRLAADRAILEVKNVALQFPDLLTGAPCVCAEASVLEAEYNWRYYDPNPTPGGGGGGSCP